jgi:hypothetical protein
MLACTGNWNFKRSLLGQREKGTFLVCACDVSGIELEGMNRKLLQGRYVGSCVARLPTTEGDDHGEGTQGCVGPSVQFKGASWHVDIAIWQAARCPSCTEPTQPLARDDLAIF